MSELKAVTSEQKALTSELKAVISEQNSSDFRAKRFNIEEKRLKIRWKSVSPDTANIPQDDLLIRVRARRCLFAGSQAQAGRFTPWVWWIKPLHPGSFKVISPMSHRDIADVASWYRRSRIATSLMSQPDIADVFSSYRRLLFKVILAWHHKSCTARCDPVTSLEQTVDRRAQDLKHDMSLVF